MFIHPWNKTLNSVITSLFALLLFFVPLVFWPTSELFEFNKMMLTYLLTGIILITFLSQAVINKKLIIRRTPLDLPILLFLIGQVLATIYSIDPHTSIWGYYSRFHGGLASTLSYLVLYYVAITHFTQEETKSHLKLIFYSLLTSASLVAFYGVLEHFGIDKDLWVQDVQNRVFSTLGQPNWLSAYLVAILPLPLVFTLNSKQNNHFFLYLTITLTLFLAILFTKSRSGIATTFIVLTLIFLRQLFLHPKNPLKTNFNLFLVIPIFLFTLLIVGTPWSPNLSQLSTRIHTGGPLWPEGETYLNYLNLTSEIKPLDPTTLPPETQSLLRAQNQGIHQEGSNSWDIRQVVWEGALELFRRHPYLGTGLETFGYSYYWVRPKAHNLLSEWDFLYNKAHNEYLNFLATTGLIGTTTYLFLVISILLLFIYSLKRKDLDISSDFRFALLVGYLSILITNYFGFSVVPVALLFFLYPTIPIILRPNPQFFHLGPGWQIAKKQLKNLKKKDRELSLAPYQYLLLIFLFFSLGYWVLLLNNRWFADLKYSKGRSYSQLGYLSESLPLLESAVKLYPTEPNFRAALAETYASAALATDQQFNALPASQSAELEATFTTQKQHFTDLALENIALTREQNPWHLNFVKSEAKIYLTLAQIDPEYYQSALTTLLKANELAPTDAKIIYNIGLLHLALGNQDQAQTAFRHSIELKPNYDQPLIEIIKLLASQDKNQEAQKYLDQLLSYYPQHEGKTNLIQLLD